MNRIIINVPGKKVELFFMRECNFPNELPWVFLYPERATRVRDIKKRMEANEGNCIPNEKKCFCSWYISNLTSWQPFFSSIKPVFGLVLTSWFETKRTTCTLLSFIDFCGIFYFGHEFNLIWEVTFKTRLFVWNTAQLQAYHYLV